jgi:hypothetical protein
MEKSDMTNSPFYAVKTRFLVLVFMTVLIAPDLSAQKDLRIGLHATPLVSWFGTDNSQMTNHGSLPGFNFGISLNRYFDRNYAFTLGLEMENAGGRLSYANDSQFEFSNKETTYNETVLANNAVTYNIRYVALPIGLQLQTMQIGYVTFFANLGVDPKVVAGAKASIPAQDIDKQTALSELKVFNLGYFVKAGIEYSIGGETSAVVSMGYKNNFLDVTKDMSDLGQIKDKITQNILSLQLGIIF